ncbi:MAG TPA: hypothetical protein VFY14_21475, partial [Streptomyces sp.]|nr:hypothetical protein [Streptomyces sp.]
MTEYPIPQQPAARPMGGGARTATPVAGRADAADAAHAALPEPRDEPCALDLEGTASQCGSHGVPAPQPEASPSAPVPVSAPVPEAERHIGRGGDTGHARPGSGDEPAGRHRPCAPGAHDLNAAHGAAEHPGG